VNVAPGFTDMPSVINGESDLLVQLWGERDRHARVVLGVASLRRAAPVETEVIVRVRIVNTNALRQRWPPSP